MTTTSKYCDSMLGDEDGCVHDPERIAHICNRYAGHSGEHHCAWDCQKRWTTEESEAQTEAQADAAYERAKQRFSQ